jgi:hypothetical protein
MVTSQEYISSDSAEHDVGNEDSLFIESIRLTA